MTSSLRLSKLGTRVTRQYKVLVFSSKLFANMRLNFAGHPMPLLPTMLLQAQAGDGAEYDHSSDPYETTAGSFLTREDAPLGGDFHTSPLRSTHAPPAGQPSGDKEDPITLTTLSSVVTTLVQKVHSLEAELHDHKRLFKDVVGKLVKKVKTLKVKLKTKKRKMVIFSLVVLHKFLLLAHPTAVPFGAFDVPPGPSVVPPSGLVVPPGPFAGPFGDLAIPSGTSTVPAAASTVPAGNPNVPAAVTSSDAPAGVSSKGKSPMLEEDIPVKARTFKHMKEDRLGEEAAKQLHDEEMAHLERKRVEVQRKRQQDVLDSAMYYNESDWLNIRAQVEANAYLSKTLLVDDVFEANFPARMVALIRKKSQALAEQLFKERQNRPMTQIRKVQSHSQIQDFGRTLKRPGPVLEEPSSKRPKSPEAPPPSMPEVPLSLAVSSPPSSRTRRKSLGQKHMHKPKSTLPKLDLDAPAQTFLKVVVNEDSDDEILHMVDRQGLMKLYGLVVQYYETHPVAGAGMLFWDDLQLLLFDRGTS
nr:JmjC domain-containing protein [Tanacetum cinerariifolium]